MLPLSIVNAKDGARHTRHRHTRHGPHTGHTREASEGSGSSYRLQIFEAQKAPGHFENDVILFSQDVILKKHLKKDFA